MASVLNLLIVCATLIVATSAQLDPQLFQSLLNPTPADCANSALLRRLGLCNRFANQQGEGEAGAEQEAEQEVEVEQEAEQEAEAEVEAEAEQEVEQEVEPQEAEIEQEAEMEQEAQMPRRPYRGRTHSMCGVYHFACRSIKKCIPNHQVCNGADNCGDNSDEMRCPSRRRFV